MTEGAFVQQLRSENCPQRRIYNVMTLVDRSGKVQRVLNLNCTSLAGPILQRDAMLIMMPAAQVAIGPTCRTMRVTDTSFEGFTGPPNPKALHQDQARPWKEHWTFDGCGSSVKLLVLFAPDERGTGIGGSATPLR